MNYKVFISLSVNLALTTNGSTCGDKKLGDAKKVSINKAETKTKLLDKDERVKGTLFHSFKKGHPVFFVPSRTDSTSKLPDKSIDKK